MQYVTTEMLNAMAPGWIAAMRAALVQGAITLAVICIIWALCRRHMSHAFAHGLFFIVPVKTAAAALFVAWPVVLSFTLTVPEGLMQLIHEKEEVKLSPAPKLTITDNSQPISSIIETPQIEEPILTQVPQYQFEVEVDTPVLEVMPVEGPLERETDIYTAQLTRNSKLMMAWASGVIFFLTLFLINHCRVMRRLYSGQIIHNPKYQDLVNKLVNEMQVRCSVRILETTAIATPAVTGLFQQTLLIPAGFFNSFDEDEIRWTMLHELAHVRRRDLWWLAIERAVGLSLFFHPALLIARRITRYFRELACDDIAREVSGLSSRTCAEAFLKLIIWSGRHSRNTNAITPALSLTDRYPAIQKRIMNMTDTNEIRRSTRLSRASIIAIGMMAVLVSLPLSPTIVTQAATIQPEAEFSASDDANLDQSGAKSIPSNLPQTDLDEIQKLTMQLDATLPKLDSFNPVNKVAIPNNPPPHDGSMFDFPTIINPPDIIMVEVLKALPGRPIAGERVVQPDGTIGLGYYGRLHVAGLTLDQIKSKLSVYLRQYLDDESLGLVAKTEAGKWQVVEPTKSAKIIVDLGQNNSQFYYVTGAVEAPGRYPIIGKETVLDAIASAKGLKDDANSAQFILMRPTHDGTPHQKYLIDWKKINEEGDRKSNLQIFPGDRLIVQKKTMDDAAQNPNEIVEDNLIVVQPGKVELNKPSEPLRNAHKAGESVTLQVLDERNDNPVAGAKVVAWIDGKRTIVNTDEIGRTSIAFDATKNDVIKISVSKSGFVGKHQVWKRDASPVFPPMANLVWKLKPGMKVGGRVVDPAGKPIANAKILLFYRLDKNAEIINPLEQADVVTDVVTSNAEGRWESSQVPPDSTQISMRVSHLQYVCDPILVPFFPPFATIKNGSFETVMTRGMVFTGRLLAKGQPVEGAKVYHNKGKFEVDPIMPVSGPDGIFKIENLIPEFGDLRLAIMKPGFAMQIKTVETKEFGQTETWELHAGKTIHGSVKDVAGKPVPDAKIYPFELTHDGINLDHPSTFTDEQGRFALPDMPEESVDLVVLGNGFIKNNIKVDNTDQREIQVVLERAIQWNGTVKDKVTKQPIPNFELNVISRSKNTITNMRLTSTNMRLKSDKISPKPGHFKITSSDPASEGVHLRIEAPGYKVYSTAEIRNSGSPVTSEILLEPITEKDPYMILYKGRILQPDGKPAVDAQIGLKAVFCDPVLRSGRVLGTINYALDSVGDIKAFRTDENGSFVFRHDAILQGLWVTHPSGAIRFDINIEKRTNLEIRLKSYSRIEGEYLVDGHPGNLGVIRLNYPNIDRGFDESRVAIPDEKGRFSMDHVFPGEIALWYPGESAKRYRSDRGFEIRAGETLKIEASVKDDKLQEKLSFSRSETIKAGSVPVKENQELAQRVEPKTNANATPIKSVELNAISPRTIGGTVVDSNKKPIADAEISFLYVVEELDLIFDPKRLPPVKSDKDGKFRIEGISDQHKYAFLQVTHSGNATKQIRFGREDTHYESLLNNNAIIELPAGMTVKGKVFDLQGKTLPGATVYHSPTLYFNNANMATTNAAGEFIFNNLEPETPTQIIYAKKTGYGTATYKIARTDTIPPEVKLQMAQPREFKATITDVQGRPIAGVAVELRIRDIINGEFRVATKSDADGKITFADLPTGKDIYLYLTRAGYAMDIQTVKGDDLSEKKYELRKGVAASGSVKNSRTLQPLEHFKVTVEVPKDTKPTFSNQETHEFKKGNFRLGTSSFSPESFHLIFEAEGFKPFRTASYKIDDTPPILDVKLDPMPVAELPHYRGKIIQPDGKPAGRIKIGITTEHDFPRIENEQIIGTYLGRPIPMSDENGEFDFHTPEPVKEIVVLHESGAIIQTIDTNQDLQKLQLKLQPYGRLVGSLKRDGKPDFQSRLFLVYRSVFPHFFLMHEQIKINKDGSFAVDRIIPGVISLNYELANLVENSRLNPFVYYSVKPGETVRADRDMKLADVPRRDVVGKIVFPDGKIPGDLSLSRIVLLPPTGNPLRKGPGDYLFNSEKRMKYRESAEGRALDHSLFEFQILTKEISKDGVFRISGVPVGQFELAITPGTSNIHYGTASKPIEITPLKSGELNTPIDLGEFMVERPQVPPQK